VCSPGLGPGVRPVPALGLVRAPRAEEALAGLTPDPARGLERARRPLGRGLALALAPPPPLPEGGRRGAVPGPPLTAGKKGALDPSRLKGIVPSLPDPPILVQVQKRNDWESKRYHRNLIHAC